MASKIRRGWEFMYHAHVREEYDVERKKYVDIFRVIVPFGFLICSLSVQSTYEARNYDESIHTILM